MVKIPWRRKWQPTLILLPREFHGQRNLLGYSPWGRKELDMTQWLKQQYITYSKTKSKNILMGQLACIGKSNFHLKYVRTSEYFTKLWFVRGQLILFFTGSHPLHGTWWISIFHFHVFLGYLGIYMHGIHHSGTGPRFTSWPCVRISHCGPESSIVSNIKSKLSINRTIHPEISYTILISIIKLLPFTGVIIYKCFYKLNIIIISL